MKDGAMMKVIGTIIGIIVVILLGVMMFLWGKSKTDWREEMSVYGPLNTMDFENSILQKKNETYYNLKLGKEYKIGGSVEISNGKVTILYIVGNNVIYEKELDNGTYDLDAVEVIGLGSDICLKIIASEDVEGSYDIKVYSRETNAQRLFRRMEEHR